MAMEDLDQVVELHIATFPNRFKSVLGPRFLYLIYRGLLEYEGGICLIAADNDKIVGIVVGSTDHGKFNVWLLRGRWFALATSTALTAIFTPRTIPSLIRILRRPKEAKQSSVPAVLMVITVLPGLQGRGIGSELTTRFLLEMRERGIPTVALTTDRDNNDAINSFYEHYGFEFRREIVSPEGRPMNEYLISLGDLTL